MGRRAVVTLDNGCKRPGFESLNPKRKRAFYSCYAYTVKISVFYSILLGVFFFLSYITREESIWLFFSI